MNAPKFRYGATGPDTAGGQIGRSNFLKIFASFGLGISLNSVQEVQISAF